MAQGRLDEPLRPQPHLHQGCARLDDAQLAVRQQVDRSHGRSPRSAVDQRRLPGRKRPLWTRSAAGSFYLDEATSRLYVGSDPTGKTVTASTLTQAMNLRSSGITVRGIGIRRYSPSVWHVGAVTLEKPGITFENVRISEMATTGISVQSSSATLRRVTVDNSGMLGIHGRFADNLTLDRVSSTQNNRENFNLAPVSGGVKLGATRGVTVTDSNFSDNYGHGFWEDMSVYNSVFRGTNFSRQHR